MRSPDFFLGTGGATPRDLEWKERSGCLFVEFSQAAFRPCNKYLRQSTLKEGRLILVHFQRFQSWPRQGSILQLGVHGGFQPLTSWADHEEERKEASESLHPFQGNTPMMVDSSLGSASWVSLHFVLVSFGQLEANWSHLGGGKP